MLVKFYLNVCLCFVLVFVFSYKAGAKTHGISSKPQQLYFIENKGQIKDQYNLARKDIQYSLQGQGVAIFIGNGQLHYQFSKKDFCSPQVLPGTHTGLLDMSKSRLPNNGNIPAPAIETYRMDVELAGANRNAEVITEDKQAYYENYFLPGCATNGIQAHSYRKLVYKNVYPFIDWVLYIKDNKLEYDFIVNPGGDVKDIKIKYNGATNIASTGGTIIIKTPFGDVSERNLYAYEQASGKPVAAGFKFKNDILGFSLPSAHGLQHGAIVIDPILEWGTYYGDSVNYSPFYGIISDRFSNIYACGYSWSNTPGLIATTGSFQDTIGGGADAILVKFDSSGNRIWATYYGGNGEDYGYSVACDTAGNVYMGGATSSQNNITTPGAQEPAWIWITLNVGFVVKFDSSGTRQWSTYVGGSNGATFDLEIYSVCCDNYGHVYVSGATDDTSNVGTPGTFKPYKTEGDADTSIDCFLIQYNAVTGLRNWGTYYGNLHVNFNGYSCTDGINVYLTGYTNCTIDTEIATPSSYQPAFFGGGTDAFLVKFDTTGNRIWGTYYGGEGNENTGGVGCDTKGNVYMYGITTSDSNIASPGCFQANKGGAYDAFVAAFTSSGARIWGTYYGGPGIEYCNSGGLIVVGDYLYITGGTASDTGMVSGCSWQPVYGGGGEDAYLAQFIDSNGFLNWSTYYGGSDRDEGWDCAYDGKSIYLCGLTSSINNIATPGSFDPTGGGGGYEYQGFLAKFDFTYSLQAIAGPSSVCVSDTVFLSDPTSGGTWSCSSGIVRIDSVTGRLIGISAGATIITYTTSSGCFVTIPDSVVDCYLNTPLQVKNNTVAIYPNPVFDDLMINTNQSGYQSFVINNSIGQEVLCGNLNSPQTAVNVKSLPQGIYFITLNGEGGNIIRKFVKE